MNTVNDQTTLTASSRRRRGRQATVRHRGLVGGDTHIHAKEDVNRVAKSTCRLRRGHARSEHGGGGRMPQVVDRRAGQRIRGGPESRARSDPRRVCVVGARRAAGPLWKDQAGRRTVRRALQADGRDPVRAVPLGPRRSLLLQRFAFHSLPIAGVAPPGDGFAPCNRARPQPDAGRCRSSGRRPSASGTGRIPASPTTAKSAP